MADPQGQTQATSQNVSEPADRLMFSPGAYHPTHLTPHFTVEELIHTDTGLPNDPPLSLAGNIFRLADTLEQVRELAGVPLHVSSGYRSERVNRAVGGVDTSEHLFGRAADFVPMGMDIGHVFGLIQRSGIVWNQLIHEHSAHSEWIHLSIPCAHEPGKHEVMVSQVENGKMRYHRV